AYNAVAPRLFGGVQAGVGGLYQGLGGLARMPLGNADGESYTPEMFAGSTLEDFPRRYQLAKVLGDPDGVIDVRVREDDCELLTAVARDEVLPSRVLGQDRRDQAKNL